MPAPRDRLFWTAALLIVITDVVTKMFAVRYLVPRHVPHRIIGDVVRFTLAFNPGAAFSMYLGAWSRWIFMGLTLIALVVLWRMYRHTAPTDRVRALALGLICGGAVGNLIDRIRSPAGVVDFIDIGVGMVRFWTFNVADSGVTIGAFLLVWVLWQEDVRAQRAAQGRDDRPGGARERA